MAHLNDELNRWFSEQPQAPSSKWSAEDAYLSYVSWANREGLFVRTPQAFGLAIKVSVRGIRKLRLMDSGVRRNYYIFPPASEFDDIL